MGQALSLPLRQRIQKLQESGKSHRYISDILEVKFYTIRKLCREFKKRGSIEPRYDRCKGVSPISKKVIRSGVSLKKIHQGWGAERIRIELQQRYPKERIPSLTTLRGYFRKAGVSTPLKRRRIDPQPKPTVRAGQEHDVWQIDGVEKRHLKTGEPLSWLSITDEYSGGLLSGKHFPPWESKSGRSRRSYQEVV